MKVKLSPSPFVKMYFFVLNICLFSVSAHAGQPVLAAERRIVSLAPSTTEWIVALGLESQLRGTTEQCDFPPQVRNTPKVGSYLRGSMERILALRATDVVVAEPLPEVMRRRLEASGVRLHEFAPQRLVDFPTHIRKLGVALGVPQAGEQWSLKFRQAMESTAHDFLQSKRSPRRALMFVSVEPVYIVGHTQWLSDLFRLSGFENAFNDARIKDNFPRISFEVLSRFEAQVWFAFNSGDTTKDLQQKQLTLLSQKISRSSKPAIRILPADIFQRPGPRLLDAMTQLKGGAL